MLRRATEPRFTCASCEAEIRASVVFHVGIPFCCAGCVAGGPCVCSYDLDEPGPDGGAGRPAGPRVPADGSRLVGSAA